MRGVWNVSIDILFPSCLLFPNAKIVKIEQTAKYYMAFYLLILPLQQTVALLRLILIQSVCRRSS